jgi:hypothetical protein
VTTEAFRADDMKGDTALKQQIEEWVQSWRSAHRK